MPEMPNYCTARIRLPNGCDQDVTIVLHADTGDRYNGGKRDGFLPTHKPLSLHLGSGSRSWRGGRVEEMDGAGYPVEDDVMVTTGSGPPIVAAHYGNSGDENLGNVLARLMAANMAMKTTIGGQPLSSRWPLVLLPHDWRHLCVQQLNSVLYRLVNLGIRVTTVVVVLLLSCQILLSSRQYHHFFSDYFSTNINKGGGVGSNGVERETQDTVPVVLLPFDLPNQLNDAVYQNGGPLLAGTNFLVNETAPAVAKMVARCNQHRLPNSYHHQPQYSSPLCEFLCRNGSPEKSRLFSGSGPLLELEKSLYSIRVARNFWLEDLSPRWLDMAHAQAGELQRTYGDNYDTEAISKGLDPDLNFNFSHCPYPYPNTTISVSESPLPSSPSSSPYSTTLETNIMEETRISEAELRSRLHGLLLFLRCLPPTAGTYADTQAKARSLFETEFVPRNDRLRHSYHRAVSGFLPDPNLIDITWRGAIATFVQWEEWIEEVQKVLTTVMGDVIDFNRRPIGNEETYAGDYNGGKGKDSRKRDETDLVLVIQTTCSKALGHIHDARTAADALVQRMQYLHRVAEAYSASGWRVRRSVMDLEHEGMVPVDTILNPLESGKGRGENEKEKRKGGLGEQMIEAWVFWPVGRDVQEHIAKAATFLAPPDR